MGKLIIFSAPSGSGKTTVVKYLLKSLPELSFSVSATTRKKRPNEVHGKDYYFFTQEDFEQRVEDGEFLEHEEVYEGLYYGTMRSEVERLWSEGKHVIFDVDVKGGVNLKQQFGDQALAVFLRPPSVDVLMERLKKRETEVEHELKERIDKANLELQFEEHFDTVIINDILEDTFKEATEVVQSFIDKEITNRKPEQKD
jgi:guanylate kinase